jgi:leader peptidase (prepilin peptidase) / N-methyltransferase
VGGYGFDASVLGILGLLVGSFLNVVIHRLPIMMERQWKAECSEMHDRAAQPAADTASFNLMVPRSRCPHCGHVIRAHENIPVLSWLFLRGKCSDCRGSISPRYPLVELATGLLFAFSGWRFGLTATGVCWAAFCAALVSLALIDWDTTLLPDDITLPLLWGGLVAAMLGWVKTPFAGAFWGAVAGYVSLWLIYWAFKLLTGKEGMGYGDFKLFGALGAWLGWPMLIPVILMASVIGSVVGIGMKMSSSLREGRYVPFGPFLALGGLTVLVLGPDTFARLLRI